MAGGTKPIPRSKVKDVSQDGARKGGGINTARPRGKIDERLARWILMTHDRVPGNTIDLTHEFLATMLAVRRAGVTEALKILQQQKLISCARGKMTLLNRKGLEKLAGAFYGTPEAEYRRLMN